MKLHKIQVVVCLENNIWVAIFERNDAGKYAVARQIFGSEPTDPELHNFITEHYQLLKFTEPKYFNLTVKRKNPKRMKREVKKVMQKTKNQKIKTTRAQEILKLDLETKKKAKLKTSKSAKEQKIQKKFLLKQAKKKKKQRGY